MVTPHQPLLEPMHALPVPCNLARREHLAARLAGRVRACSCILAALTTRSTSRFSDLGFTLPDRSTVRCEEILIPGFRLGSYVQGVLYILEAFHTTEPRNTADYSGISRMTQKLLSPGILRLGH